jgi:rare lipoprotein A
MLVVLALSGCAETQLAAHIIKSLDAVPSDGGGDFKVGQPYTIAGKTYHPRERYDFTQTGVASWYGHKFHGKETANGERFSRFELTAAHKTLQLPSLVQVTNLENGRSLVVRVNDRGPFKRGRIIDLSERAAELLGFKNQGTARVRLNVLEKQSRRIAAAAKRGESTSGAAIAANKALQRRQRLAQASTSAQQTAEQRRRVQAQQSRQQTQKREPAQLAKVATQKPERRRQQAYERPRRHVRQERLGPQQHSDNSSSQHALRNEQPQKGNTQQLSPNNARLENPELPTSLAQAEQERSKGQQRDVVRETAEVPTTKIGELVQKQDVAPTALYVQAGSFTKQNNAKQLALKLRRVADTNISRARVDGSRFYRVRLGPLENVERADEVLNRVIALGHNNAMIVVDEKQQT